MQKTSLPKINQLTADFSQFNFEPAKLFYWSASNNTVYYNPKDITKIEGIFRLLHEVGHALLAHKSYESGIELIRLESQAWQKAKKLADTYDLIIDQQQIESCLDSYRDWLHLRSTCPNCQAISTETSVNQYRCFNCGQKWKVPVSQLSKHYRMKQIN